MRIVQSLASPLGVLGLTLLAFMLAFVALVLDQANFKSPVLVWVFGILAILTGLGALVAFLIVFGTQTEKLWTWIKGLRRYLWLTGGSLVFGLLLGGMEWLISASLYNALGIGAAAYALAQLGLVKWASRAEQLHEEAERASTDTEILNQKLIDARGERDAQLRARCFYLSERLRKFLKNQEKENQKTVDQYKQQFSGEVAAVISDLKDFEWWDSEKHAHLEFPETRQEIELLDNYLRDFGFGCP